MLKLKLLGPPDAKSQLIGKDPDGRKDWRQEEKWLTEDEMVGWDHLHDGHEVEQTPGDSEGEGSPVCAVHGVAKSRRQLRNWTTNANLKYSVRNINYDHKTNYVNGFINNQLDGLRKNSYSCRHRTFSEGLARVRHFVRYSVHLTLFIFIKKKDRKKGIAISIF